MGRFTREKALSWSAYLHFHSCVCLELLFLLGEGIEVQVIGRSHHVGPDLSPSHASPGTSRGASEKLCGKCGMGAHVPIFQDVVEGAVAHRMFRRPL